MKFSVLLKKVYDTLLSTRAAGIYLLLFAGAIGIATFIENDFGTSAAQKLVFRARWFELLLVLFGATIIANIFRFRMVKQKKWAQLVLHSAIIVILLGSAITRYYGYEGMMHIREGGRADHFLSFENNLVFKAVKDGKSYSFAEEVLFASLGSNHFDKSYQTNSDLWQVRLKQFIPNPEEKLEDDPSGAPVMKVVIAGQRGREEYFVRYGDRTRIGGVNFNFSDQVIPEAFNVRTQNDSLYFMYAAPVIQTVMATQTTDTLMPGAFLPLRLRSMYQVGPNGFVIGDFRPKAKMSVVPGDKKMKNESQAGLVLSVSRNGQEKEILVTGQKGVEGKPEVVDFGESRLEVSYGARKISVPFSLALRDFIMERYPGTDNPSSYASEVTVEDPAKGFNMPFRIYMNNILNYGGYRFFQSSFDQDEAGTYLSVNHDFWGTWVSYIGYILLTIGMLMTFFMPNSRFVSLVKRLSDSKGPAVVLALITAIQMMSVSTVYGQTNTPAAAVSRENAALLGKMLVQDHRGRFKPVNTLSGEVIRKMARKESLYGMNSDQMFFSMLLDPESWENVKLIHAGTHPGVLEALGTTEKMISYRQLFDDKGEYKLRDHVRQAQAMNPKDQGTFEKTIIKLDEKVNIANMVFTGRLLKIFPLPGDPSHRWASPADMQENKFPHEDMNSQYMNFSSALVNTGQGNAENLETALHSLAEYQARHSGSVLPSESKVKAELLLNQLDVFGRLRNIYGMLSLVFLGVFFYTIFRHDKDFTGITRYGWWVIFGFFVLHSFGLALRWYVSGRAPWSNGYESMIYISWTTVLAGLIFSRRSLGGMSATLVLAATILLVASMSWLDPEITPLVPVLRSYWLTIHVSLEAGSYGFLMLGAVIGMLNLILMIVAGNTSKDRIYRTIRELTTISEITLWAGLFMVSVGTYLGGVWANESWGRYWGWDAKETWALVTVLVYAFILHMRFIPGLQSVFAFNFASLFGFATVIMTYFGVNYYLSGLHSYAAGDPVPVPPAVYITAAVLAVISVLAYAKYRKLK